MPIPPIPHDHAVHTKRAAGLVLESAHARRVPSLPRHSGKRRLPSDSNSPEIPHNNRRPSMSRPIPAQLGGINHPSKKAHGATLAQPNAVQQENKPTSPHVDLPDARARVHLELPLPPAQLILDQPELALVDAHVVLKGGARKGPEGRLGFLLASASHVPIPRGLYFPFLFLLGCAHGSWRRGVDGLSGGDREDGTEIPLASRGTPGDTAYKAPTHPSADQNKPWRRSARKSVSLVVHPAARKAVARDQSCV